MTKILNEKEDMIDSLQENNDEMTNLLEDVKEQLAESQEKENALNDKLDAELKNIAELESVLLEERHCCHTIEQT